MMGGVSEESLLDYFYSAGGNSGRVRNADILKTFKPFIGHSDPQLRAKYREEFKLTIDRIAVVKSENGEKYLILKKKYRTLLQERDTKHHGTDKDPQRQQSPARTTATAQWETRNIQTSSPCKKEQQDEPMSSGEPDEEEQQEGTDSVRHSPHPPSAAHTNDPSALSNGEDELDRDSTSKSELEHDEESTGSMGSAAVALDPTEKEWIYYAASARVRDLSQLLRQEPSLANKKDFTSTALHWAAKHGNQDMAALVADAGADVNTKSHVSNQPFIWQ
ncbi:ankyrin repeat domain-containing protein SOWAHB isoform X2 [Girardinichthys multiradiatus]|uniref:ankyrin repeat domain-containing protein SOWAHB isoform X2 n=1 Tax=Girardinichthys multiradiatus TaxID=208333 RepID=UPI001FAB9FB9|nr:ankyrin repeat domain-containing protein SOWAHB isoform X2 [Girardinichthys multiradiatus]